MPAPRDPGTLMRAAHLYYINGKSQAEIATLLDTSRSNVSRMLTEAQRQGIVEIRINDPSGRAQDLEVALQKTFGLQDVLVAQRGAGGAERIANQVGALAAQLLLQQIKDSMTVAMSWGHALQAMVWATTSDHDYDAQVVQLVGGMSSISNEISGHELVRELAARLGSSYRFLHSPATYSSTAARDTMLARPRLPTPWGPPGRPSWRSSGSAPPATARRPPFSSSLNLSAAEEQDFWAANPVGDVAARYFNASGQPIRGAVESHVLGVSLRGTDRDPQRGRGGLGPRQDPRGARRPTRSHHRFAGVRRKPRTQRPEPISPSRGPLTCIPCFCCSRPSSPAGSCSSISPTGSRWHSTTRCAGCARRGTVSVGVAGNRYRGGRSFVAIAVDDHGIVRDALTLRGWTTFARARPLPGLLGLKANQVKGTREVPDISRQQREAARQAVELLHRQEGRRTTSDATA